MLVDINTYELFVRKIRYIFTYESIYVKTTMCPILCLSLDLLNTELNQSSGYVSSFSTSVCGVTVY